MEDLIVFTGFMDETAAKCPKCGAELEITAEDADDSEVYAALDDMDYSFRTRPDGNIAIKDTEIRAYQILDIAKGTSAD